MKVWVVLEYNGITENIVGVFAQKEKAIEIQKESLAWRLVKECNVEY